MHERQVHERERRMLRWSGLAGVLGTHALSRGESIGEVPSSTASASRVALGER